MKKIITILFFLASFFTAFGQPPSGTHGTNSTGPQFTFINNDRVHDFGAIERNNKESYQFQFKNSGDKPLLITEMHASPNEKNSPPYKIVFDYPKYAIKPGRKAMITLTIAAQGDAGSFKNEIYVNSNATPPDYKLFIVAGAVVPDKGKYHTPAPDLGGWFELLTPIVVATQ
jgi:hypothetical protein